MDYKNLIKFVSSVRISGKGNATFIADTLLRDGGKGSGNFGHKGRIGKRGGSAKINAIASFESMKRDYQHGKNDAFGYSPQANVYKDLVQMRNWFKNEAGGSKETDNAPLVKEDYDYLIHKISNALHRKSNRGIEANDNEDDYFTSKKQALSAFSSLALTKLPFDAKYRIDRYYNDREDAQSEYWEIAQQEARKKAHERGQQFSQKHWKEDYGEFDEEGYANEWYKDPNVTQFKACIDGRIVQFTKRQAQALARMNDEGKNMERTMQAIDDDPSIFADAVSALQKIMPLPKPQTRQQQQKTQQQFIDRATDKQYQQRQAQLNDRERTELTPSEYKKSLFNAKADIKRTIQESKRYISECNDTQQVLAQLGKTGLFRNVQRKLVQDVDIAKQMSYSILDSIERFPFLAGWMQRIETDMDVERNNSTASAVCVGSRKIVPVGIRTLSKNDVDIGMEMFESKKINPPVDTGRAYYVFTHEMGHSLMGALEQVGFDVNGMLQNVLSGIGFTKSTKNYQYKTAQEQNVIKDCISDYANTDLCQLFAQLYAQAYCSKNPRKSASFFRSLLEQSIANNRSKLEALK